jgi:hypothetical protein
MSDRPLEFGKWIVVRMVSPVNGQVVQTCTGSTSTLQGSTIQIPEIANPIRLRGSDFALVEAAAVCSQSRPERVVCWFSCGAASAAATKLALERYPDAVIAYCASTLSTEHPDNARFLEDCEKWYGKSILRLYADKYTDIYDVFDKTGWLVGPAGARCTTELKKMVRRRFQQPGDLHVFGFDYEEAERAEKFRLNNLDVDMWAPLVDLAVTKSECFDMLRKARIALPAMYRLGYRNNNCIGCVKGGLGYWNKIRKDFPDVFARMAAQEKKMGVRICKVTRIDPDTGKKKRMRTYLEDIPPDAGRYEAEPAVQCGVLCEVEDLETAQGGN